MKDFAYKFMDIMMGVVLGLGFQWWPNLHEPWQFAAFIFAYIIIIDYWVDTAAALKKFPPKRELDIVLDVATMFSFFLFIYYAQATIIHFLAVFVAFRILDALWIFRVKNEYSLTPHDDLVMNTWLVADFIEAAVAASLIAANYFLSKQTPIMLLAIFVSLWLVTRIWSSLRYKRIYFA